MIIQSITEHINNTPLIELKKIYKGKGQLFAKMEHIQPGGSVKNTLNKSIGIIIVWLQFYAIQDSNIK